MKQIEVIKKKVYFIQTILLIIYLAVTPLLVSHNPIIFHDIKLKMIYFSISMLFLVSIFFYHYFREEHVLSFKTFKTERRLIGIAVIMMLISFFVNLNDMRALLTSDSIGSNLFKGAGPNYLSIFFYFFSFIFIATGIVAFKHTDNKLIIKAVLVSLVIVGCVIIYQLFVNDFLGKGPNYLFGWGNSNYVSDPFSIVGLILLIPLIFKEKINYLYLGIGIFFFEIVLLSGSRAAFVGLFLSVIITSFVLFRTKKTDVKRILTLYGLSILIIIVSYILFSKFGLDKNIDNLGSANTLVGNEELDKYSLYSRINLWKISLKYFASSPTTVLFGMGQSVFAWDSDTMHYLVSNTHNQYIDILLSGGIVVFSIFITLLYKQFMYVIKLIKYNTNNIVLLSCLIFICTKWMFNSFNAIHSPFILMVFVLISYRYMEMKRANKDISLARQDQ